MMVSQLPNELEDIVEESNLIVEGTIDKYEGIKTLNVGDADIQYHIYNLKIKETIKGVTKKEVKIRVFNLYDEDDVPFVVGNKYICFLWDTDSFPAVLLNRNQSAIMVNENDVLLNNDTLVAFESTFKSILDNQQKLKNIDSKTIIRETDRDIYEDIIYTNCKEDIVMQIKSYQ